MTNLIIFDKDQTLVTTLSGEHFVQHPRDQQILAGAAKAVRNFKEQGFNIAIASNQGGVENGFKMMDSAIVECRYALELFPEIDFAVFAPNYRGTIAFKVERNKFTEIIATREIEPMHGGYTIETCSKDYGAFRKPGPGMLNWIMEFYGATPSETWFVGDREEDEGAAEAAGTNFMSADIVRARFSQDELQINSSMRVTTEGLELLDPGLKGIQKWE